MKIKIVGLHSCGKCDGLKKKLKDAGVRFDFSDCDRNPQNCDNLEALTGTTHYPMVLLEDAQDNLLEVYYLTEHYETLIKGSYSQNRIKLVPTHSTDSLFRYAKDRVNYKL
jgi:hypothetical protein